ncbi:MAG: hypothetical protein H6733_02255 [Alphaproteobacteria bacterium]|nr:hypothetical protein [Alphaproteobacteria bacterium]
MARLNLLAAGLLVGLSVGGCKPPLHLGYDFGRAFVETLRVQADLTRPSVQYAGYSLYGTEAVQIRLNVTETSTEKQDDTPELSGMSGGGGGGGGR